jgi:GABA permease
MARYLVVANLTLGGDHLLEALRERVARGSCDLHVLVPAAPAANTWHSHAEEEDTAAARERLDQAIERFSALGCEVTGEVGDVRPVEAIGDVLRRDPRFDEIILSTLPPGPSRWLGMDLPKRVERAFDLDVTHVISD